MDYLQYPGEFIKNKKLVKVPVLNLIINGLPSIHKEKVDELKRIMNQGFKPYYKWITFNT